jgi:two-component system OmpR family sensor kinase
VREVADFEPGAGRRAEPEPDSYAVPQVLGDEDSLRVMLGNLVDNAIRYTPRGGTVIVRALAEGPDAVLEVEDSGPGILPEQRERVFDRVYRVPTREASEEGSGLGLAIVKRAVDRHRGRISLDSGAAGTGLRVTVRVPAKNP